MRYTPEVVAKALARVALRKRSTVVRTKELREYLKCSDDEWSEVRLILSRDLIQMGVIKRLSRGVYELTEKITVFEPEASLLFAKPAIPLEAKEEEKRAKPVETRQGPGDELTANDYKRAFELYRILKMLERSNEERKIALEYLKKMYPAWYILIEEQKLVEIRLRL